MSFHFRNKSTGNSICGKSFPDFSYEKYHFRVNCPKCRCALEQILVRCSHPDCSWSGHLNETLMTQTKRRVCPKCFQQSSERNIRINYVMDEFGTLVVLGRPDFESTERFREPTAISAD